MNGRSHIRKGKKSTNWDNARDKYQIVNIMMIYTKVMTFMLCIFE